MITATEAAKAAEDFFLSLPPELLEHPKSVRLEEIAEVDPGKWRVILSFENSFPDGADSHRNALAQALAIHRMYRKFVVDGANRKVSMTHIADD